MPPPPNEHEDADPGLAAERTRLSWTRTGIAFAAVGAAILKRQPVAGLIVLAISPVIWWLGRVVSREEGHAPRARRLLPFAEHVTLGAGHVPMWDDPPAVAAAIRACALRATGVGALAGS